jgi:hypothetical protein
VVWLCLDLLGRYITISVNRGQSKGLSALLEGASDSLTPVFAVAWFLLPAFEHVFQFVEVHSVRKPTLGDVVVCHLVGFALLVLAVGITVILIDGVFFFDLRKLTLDHGYRFAIFFL